MKTFQIIELAGMIICLIIIIIYVRIDGKKTREKYLKEKGR